MKSSDILPAFTVDNVGHKRLANPYPLGNVSMKHGPGEIANFPNHSGRYSATGKRTVVLTLHQRLQVLRIYASSVSAAVMSVVILGNRPVSLLVHPPMCQLLTTIAIDNAISICAYSKQPIPASGVGVSGIQLSLSRTMAGEISNRLTCYCVATKRCLCGKVRGMTAATHTQTARVGLGDCIQTIASLLGCGVTPFAARLQRIWFVWFNRDKRRSGLLDFAPGTNDRRLQLWHLVASLKAMRCRHAGGRYRVAPAFCVPRLYHFARTFRLFVAMYGGGLEGVAA